MVGSNASSIAAQAPLSVSWDSALVEPGGSSEAAAPGAAMDDLRCPPLRGCEPRAVPYLCARAVVCNNGSRAAVPQIRVVPMNQRCRFLRDHPLYITCSTRSRPVLARVVAGVRKAQAEGALVLAVQLGPDAYVALGREMDADAPRLVPLPGTDWMLVGRNDQFLPDEIRGITRGAVCLLDRGKRPRSSKRKRKRT